MCGQVSDYEKSFLCMPGKIVDGDRYTYHHRHTYLFFIFQV